MEKSIHDVLHTENDRLKYIKKLVSENDELCLNQVHTYLYNKLLEEGRLPRFLAVVKKCSIDGIDINEAVKVIKNTFPNYILNNELNVKAFKEMMRDHSDVAEAWGFGESGDEINYIMIKDRALSVALASPDIDTIEKYLALFNRSNTEEENKQATPEVEFRLFRK